MSMVTLRVEKTMTGIDGFHTLKGYSILEESAVTSSMEDYLEMIYRMSLTGETVRIGALSEKLHVKPSSASKMVENLNRQRLVSSKKYGYITLTDTGAELGGYLVFRHDTIHRLLCYINKSDDELEQVEKIEHFINAKTVGNIYAFLGGIG